MQQKVNMYYLWRVGHKFRNKTYCINKTNFNSLSFLRKNILCKCYYLSRCWYLSCWVNGICCAIYPFFVYGKFYKINWLQYNYSFIGFIIFIIWCLYGKFFRRILIEISILMYYFFRANINNSVLVKKLMNSNQHKNFTLKTQVLLLKSSWIRFYV